MRLKYLLVIAAAVSLLHGSVSRSQAGPSSSDWLWIAPLITTGAIGIGYVLVGLRTSAEEQAPPKPAGARPPRGMPLVAPVSSQGSDSRARVSWDPHTCSRGGEFALVCW